MQMELIQALKDERNSSSIRSIFNLPPSFRLNLFSVSNCRPIMVVSPQGPFSSMKNRYQTFSDIIPTTPHFEYDQNKFTNDDYQLISPLFQNHEFGICPSNIELFGQLSNHFQCEELIALYELCQGTFKKIGEIEQLIQIQKEVFKFNIQYFNDRKELLRQYSYYVACFLYVYGTSRPGQTVKLAEFASKLCEIDEPNGNSKEPSLKESIREYFFSRLRINQNLRRYRFKRRYPFYLFRQFYDHNLLDQEELLETIFQLNNYEGLFWFIDILPPYMEEIMYDLMKEKDLRICQHNAKAAADLKANNFELFKSVVKGAISDNSIMQAIQNDDVESLKKELPQFTGQQNIFLTPIQLINGLLPTNELLSYSALYSSFNCYIYLLEQGFHPNKTTIRAALIGGNKEIIRLIWTEINHNEFFSTFLKDACRYHRNDVFEWIQGQIPSSEIQSKGTKFVESIIFRSIQEFNFEIFIEFLHQHRLMHTLSSISAEMGNPIIYEFMWIISSRVLPLNIYFLNEFTYDTICSYNPGYQTHFYNQFNNPILFYKFCNEQLKTAESFSQIREYFFLAIQTHQYFPVKILYDMCRDIIVNECNTSKVGFLRTCVAEYSNPAILYLFLQDPRIDVNKTPEDSNGTAFTLTIWKNLVASSHILYNTGKVKINQAGNMGETPLTSCVSEEHQYAGVINFLISLPDLDVNAQNKDGKTAIKLAAERNYADAACVLLKHPDLTVSQNALEKLVDLALYHNNRALFRALFESGKLQITDLPLEDFCTKMNKPLLKEKTLIPLWTNAKSDELQLQELICRIYE